MKQLLCIYYVVRNILYHILSTRTNTFVFWVNFLWQVLKTDLCCEISSTFEVLKGSSMNDTKQWEYWPNWSSYSSASCRWTKCVDCTIDSENINLTGVAIVQPPAVEQNELIVQLMQHIAESRVELLKKQDLSIPIVDVKILGDGRLPFHFPLN